MSQKSFFTLLSIMTFLAIMAGGCTAPPPPDPSSTLAPIVEPSDPPVPEPTDPPEQADEPGPEPIVLTDGLGREVSLPGPAQRIISLAPSNVEILYAIGAGGQLIGRDDFADYPPEVLEVESIGTTFGDLNTEAIVALEPDLVLAADINPAEHIQTVEDLGIPVFMLPNPLNFEDLNLNLETVGELTGHEEEALALAESLEARVEAVTELTGDVDIVRVYYEVDGTDPSAPWTTGAGTFQNFMINLAGGENIASDIEGWAQINLEEIIARDPDVMIFEVGVWVPTTVENVPERAGWSALPAVANGQVYGIDTNWTGRPAPRLVDALEAIAQALHPELFE